MISALTVDDERTSMNTFFWKPRLDDLLLLLHLRLQLAPSRCHVLQVRFQHRVHTAGAASGTRKSAHTEYPVRMIYNEYGV